MADCQVTVLLMIGNGVKACLFPGQGSQFVTMGTQQFLRHPDLVEVADRILGYSIRMLCEEDPRKELGNTAFTQPALFVVNHLMYLDYVETSGAVPDFVAGHSLGEYNALVASGILDFESALRLVKQRGALMARVTDGGMLAVMGIDRDKIAAHLTEFDLTGIDVANYNTPVQTILSGRRVDLSCAAERFAEVEGCCCVPLNVSGPFHSRYMEDARKDFDRDLARVRFSDGHIEVISNCTARPYEGSRAAKLLSRQIVSPVNWVDSIRYLMARGVDEFIQVGPGNTINGLTKKIMQLCSPLAAEEMEVGDRSQRPADPNTTKPPTRGTRAWSSDNLGAAAFREQFGLRYACMAGGMYKGISSVAMAVAMAEAGMLGVYGAGGVDFAAVRDAVRELTRRVGKGHFAVNYIASPEMPDHENAFVDVLLQEDVDLVEASAFMSMTAPLVRYRATGMTKDTTGRPIIGHRVIAKLSHPEVARAFASAAPQRLVNQLVAEGSITQDQAELVASVPMADAITIEADSGGHTDGGAMAVLLPTIRRHVKDAEYESFGTKSMLIGAAGGIGTPEAMAAAFLLGADYVVTGSVNQCTVEADTSEAVKDLLSRVAVQDTKLAVSGDMFELGAQIQVVRKGTFFATRANKLYEIYRQYDSLDQVPAETIKQLEDKFFKRPLADVRAEVLTHKGSKNELSPRSEMAAVFKWYFMKSTSAALTGDREWRLDYQVQCGPAMGAFNNFIRGTPLEDWRKRHTSEIATMLLDRAAHTLNLFHP